MRNVIMRNILRDIVKYSIAGRLLNNLRLYLFRVKWIAKNRENQTIPMNRFALSCATVGRNTYGELNVVTFGNQAHLKIGNFVSIAEHVTFLLDVEHYLTHLSTYPFKVKMLHETNTEAFSKGDIIIEDDVWIGYGATIMSGVHIGKGAVIAANAVVTKNVPAYAIVAGIPAKLVRYRFEGDVIKEVSKLDFEKLTKEKVIAYKNDLYMQVNQKSVKEIVHTLNK